MESRNAPLQRGESYSTNTAGISVSTPYTSWPAMKDASR